MAERKSGGDIAGMAIAIAGLAIPVVEKIIDKVSEKTGDETVTVPALCDKNYPLDLEKVISVLEGCGLKATPSKLSIRNAHPKYRNCDDRQVISTKPKCGQKVPVGTTILVSYITQEVIDESLRLFEEEKKQKASVKLAKAQKRAEQRDRTKTALVETVAKTKQGLGRMIHKHKTDEERTDHEQK